MNVFVVLNLRTMRCERVDSRQYACEGGDRSTSASLSFYLGLQCTSVKRIMQQFDAPT